jgi:hypothetical protein
MVDGWSTSPRRQRAPALTTPQPVSA